MILEEYKNIRASSDSEVRNFLLSIETHLKFSSQEKNSFLQLLLDDLTTRHWEETTTTQALSIVRTLGRDPVGADPLFTEKGMLALTQLSGLHTPSMDTSSTREALKCIANCILLDGSVKAYLEKDGVINACQLILKSNDNLHMDSQFLLCRILFFLTVNRSDLVDQLVESDIAASIEKVLLHNVSLLENPQSRGKINLHAPINPYTVTSEALKLLFNLMLVEIRKSGAASVHFKACLPSIFKILFVVPYFEPQPLVPPHSQAIHALMQFNYETIAEVWTAQEDWTSTLCEEKDRFTFIATKLVDLLDRAVHVLIPTGDPDSEDTQQADATLAPLLLVIINLAEGDPNTRRSLAELMLPNEKDRLLPVHEGDSLSAYLIRLMTSTMMPQTRDAASEALFLLCEKDASKFTEKVGYGNAAGFLVNKGIPFDQPASHIQDDNGSEDINPITGQYVSEEKVPDLKDMTDEEKEREAERLFVLFERLKKTGIVDVENPIAKAMRESYGRFEEVDEEDSD